MKKYYWIIILSTLLIPVTLYAATLAETLSGKILLEVESHGEAWYVYPKNLSRYYMGRPADAFALMRQLGSGVYTRDLERIPIGLIAQSGTDTDKDGLIDTLEVAIGSDPYNTDTNKNGYSDKTEIQNGYNPLLSGQKFPPLPLDQKFIDSQKGKILLQVQDHGEAWYVNPADGKRYFLARPINAFEIMKSLSIGITSNDLQKIPTKSL